MDKIDRSPDSKEIKQERKRTIGAAVAPEDEFDYQISFLFQDEAGRPYPDGVFTLTMTPSQTGQIFEYGGGTPIEIISSQAVLPETLKLRAGGSILMTLAVDFVDTGYIGGTVAVLLPKKTSIVLVASMLTEEYKVTTSSVKEAVDTVVQQSSISATLDAMLQQTLELGLKIPIKVYEIGAELVGSGGGTGSLNLIGQYSSGDSTTDTDGTTETETREYRVVVPISAWKVTQL